MLLAAFPPSVLAQGITRATLKMHHTRNLPRAVSESSGLSTFGNRLITHNDSGQRPVLYVLDTSDARVVKEFRLPIQNVDWEDITQDSLYFYLADIGNNYHIRPLLQIYRIDKKALADDKIVLDSLSVRWPENPKTGQVFNFNCEAVVSHGDSLFFFTKEKKGTSVYAIPKTPGVHTAQFKDRFETDILITGAYLESGHLVLCGYNRMLRPFLLDMRDFKGTDFFSGSITRIKLCRRFRQIEGITSFNGKDFYISNEHFRLPWLLNKPQQLHRVTLK